MDLSKWESGAAAAPPSPPVSFSTGDPTNGDPGVPTPATVPGEYWFYQTKEEIKNLLEGALLTPDTGTLTQLLEAVQFFSAVLPFSALEYPTIETSDNRITVTPATDTNGGTVSLPVDIDIALAEEMVSGKAGRMRRLTTAAWSSADLDVSSTYYLRANISGGVFTPYVQKGTDSDTAPGSLKGTAGAGSGGGFDSTVLDILLAKVETGTAGTLPAVTELANARALFAIEDLEANAAHDINWGDWSTISLDWARAPVDIVPSCHAWRSIVTPIGTGGATGSAEVIQQLGIRVKNSDRYSVETEYVYEDETNTGARFHTTTRVSA